MNFRALATELGDALKWDTSLNEIDRFGLAILQCSLRSFPNSAITSQRAQRVYDWILSLEGHSLGLDRKKELVVEFVKRITPDAQLKTVEKILLRNGVSESLVHGLSFQETVCPDISKLTAAMPKLEQVIKDRWMEAQKCQRAGAHLAAVILMGSILEGLLLARCQMSPAEANRSTRSPKNRKSGAPLPIHEWPLNAMIDVAGDVGWLKVDRSKFSHALRESRNIVHPWQHAATNADFDEATCKTCWQVLVAAVQDLTKSI